MNAKTIVGCLISLLIGAGITYLLIGKKADADSSDFVNSLKPRIKGLVDTAIAHPNIRGHAADRAYLNMSYHKSAKLKGVLHDTADFRTYMNTTFTEFTKNHSTIDSEHVWQIGVYPMVFKQQMDGRDKPRLSFYFIPTMVKYKNGKIVEIIDYMRAINDPVLKICYVHNLRRNNPSARFDDDKYIFDEGQLWP